ncbi:HsdR family type I site-specific deoxyribonuclease [Bacillus mycoides]|uniref:type I restriction endonuclease subunit R n=1 Tax=Bacillus mycoides TaxID=1405 RepID=UPI002E1E110A|nr:HsdR family type I site-specific deoxyribonuclease [Bacillus mycoides]MED0887005.1 HsdR family type I site-specific deoxyribonuclease [Bacillus mycoides]MED0925808.1 HsdR family type I site-specific deoxyribonuclease [Bacillus mycoides]
MILSNDGKYRGKQGETIKLDENNHVEKPFLEQLKILGWNEGENEVIELKIQQNPSESYRNSFSEVILLSKLRTALKKINTFLTEGQIEEVIRKITTFDKNSLIENNQRVLELLLENTTVERNEITGELSPTVRYIDFQNIENNIFTAISQFKVRVVGTEHHIIPDIVLFINGLPVVVVEAKSSKVKEPIPEAIDQLMRYSEQRNVTGEGNQQLFYYNQFLITTCRTEAKFGTITTEIEKHFYRWTDPYPRTLNDIEHGKSSPNDQQRLVAGMLDHRNLLDIIQVFTVFKTNDKGKRIKVVGRYQQFRAVKLAVKRLIEGKNKIERGGIIWHTQGSGKSLTMMFLVREMKLEPRLQSWKIVFVTDRTQLEEQLAETGQSVGFTIKTAEYIDPKVNPNGKSLKELLSNDNSDLIMAMIHKFQEKDLEHVFPELNNKPNILIMTDEAHRSQYSLLAANLEKALPEATSIGFTGTPTEKTEKKYKDYIDKYTMRQAIDDGVTLEIVYEGLTHNAEVADKKGMDDKFEDVFSDYDLTERLKILGFGSRNAYLDAIETIKAKSKSIVNHFVEHIFSGGFKAQIVANSREAAVRYKTAIDEALKKKIAELETNNHMLINIERLKKVESAVVISGSHNDEVHIKAYTGSEYHKKSIKRFKLPFEQEDEGLSGNVGIVIVNNMLLTGFDAPVEQVLYLDKVIRAHNLLQTIARVNRIGPEGKDKGFVVDYVGVGHHLKRALDTYSEKEQQEIIDCLSDDSSELSELIEAHKAIIDFLKNNGLEDLSDSDAFFDIFYDEDIRYEYIRLYRMLTKCFNTVLPRKEALDHFNDWKNFSNINELAQKHFRDDRFSMKGIPPKLRAIADEYLKSKGIDQKVAPISIMSDEFGNNVGNRKRTKTKAAEVEHAIRHHINVNIDEDPELFASFADSLAQILEEFAGNWNKIYEELEKLREKIKNRENEATYGLDRKKQMPFFRIFRAEIFETENLTEDQIVQNVNLTQDVFNLVRNEIELTGFWDSPPAQSKLKAELQRLLVSKKYIILPNVRKKYKHLISRIMELAKVNHYIIIGGN